MVTFEIDGESKVGDDITEKWIVERFKAAAREDRLPCVIARIDKGECKVALSTPACRSGGGGGRLPNSEEVAVIQAWEQAHLNDPRYTQGNVISFLKRLKSLC